MKALDALHHCLGAFKTYPTDSVYIQANEPPLDLHSTVSFIHSITFKRHKCMFFRIQKHIEDSNLPFDIVKPVTNFTIPPWKLIKPDVDTS